MNYVIEQGWAFYWGTSEWTAQEIIEACEIADRLGLIRPPQYHILERSRVEYDFDVLYKKYNYGLTTWSPLASGILTGKYSNGIPEGSRLSIPLYKNLLSNGLEEKIAKVVKLTEIANDLGCSMAQLAIAWVASNAHVSTVILGATSIKQLDENLKALEFADKITPEIREKIDAIADFRAKLVTDPEPHVLALRKHLSGLHTAWLDDEQLNNLPIVDVFADVSTPRAQTSGVQKSSSTEKTQEQATLITDAVLNAELGDHDTQLLDAALDFPFDTELSPILEPFADATVAMSPLRMQRRQSKSPTTRRTTSSPLRRAPAVTTPRQVSKVNGEATTPLRITKRPRTRSSSWQEQEQNTFFTMFKVKWPRTHEGEQAPPFSSLLLQRFDAISTKVRTKSVMEVRQFYTTVMQNIADMLEVVNNDVDLTNPDQVRIAVWCWSKLMADKKNYEEFQALESQPESVKTRLANSLLQSIIRSRRQMLKAKSDNAASSDKPTPPGLTSISAWVSRSNLSSFFAKGNAPVPQDSNVQIHHPMVRKKHPVSRGQVALMLPAGPPLVTENAKKVLSVQQPCGESSGGAALNRKRSVSTDRSPAPGSAKKARRAVVEDATFTSPPPTNKRSRSRTRNGVAFHTPQQSRKKIYIKMRMVPRDKQTKADVVRCGCRPKVELKLSSTKKISEITAHMSKKWAKVRSLLPKGAMLCFFQKNGNDKWSKEDSNVTCFDIWKHCGKQINGENVVEVSYLWKVPNGATDSENVKEQDLMPLGAPPGLFEQKVTAATKQALSSGDESETALLSPARGLQEFGEKVAFDRSITAEAKEEAALGALISDSGDEDFGEEFSPTTGRLRRRIKPVLVSKEEFNI
ncbi:unnamed protein product [Phytophthora lilii]|uniref:Unnamed protein product n=1 Tax=Phytophthora lilii TaxID=2077276 RepID=A0A9W6WZD6_9STRA|nr:unnamed protein product [Phytophthora lilii]